MKGAEDEVLDTGLGFNINLSYLLLKAAPRTETRIITPFVTIKYRET